MKKLVFSLLILSIVSLSSHSQSTKHSFAFSNTDFLLDGKPYQVISGEMHPARIPAEYWRHRIQMAKAMGCNTIAACVFWNYQEISEGVYDFSTWNRNLAKFISIAQEEGMMVLLRPGPYVCAEWDFGGIPAYLLRIPDIKVRCMDMRYVKAVENYLSKLAEIIKPLQVDNGGPILMLQVENEYGSYGNDREYLKSLSDIWRRNGITIPFFTSDVPNQYMLEAGSIKGCAGGLNPGSDQGNFDLAYQMNPGVPVFSSQTYTGGLTHWGEQWAKPDSIALLKEVKFLMDTKKSFNLYVIHGGTNFGFTSGANSGGKGYEPSVTSYDYNAPINEQGLPTAKYFALRKLIGSYLANGNKLPDLPKPISTIEIPEIGMKPFSSIWDNLPTAVQSVQPKPFEVLDQNQGFMIYKTTLIGHKSGKLDITNLHDYATLFLNGKYIGKLDRKEENTTIRIPKSDVKDPILEILVEGMGHINFGQHIVDRKGITDRVTLNGMTLMNWEIFKFPMNDDFIASLKPSANFSKPGIFFKGSFTLSNAADTYFDLSNYSKGVVWVNGHNLGRFWEIGPQKRLYCPACWLKNGDNEVVVFDLNQVDPKTIKGMKTLE
ncbi:MAG: beta-galactosidase [Bacteroidales bacterium]|nr:beta-galactosidase [Bacteroidales bacterium]